MAELTTIARPYAQAIFALAKEQSDLKGWSAMLQNAALVAADPEMIKLIDSPRLEKADLAQLFVDVCGSTLNDFGKNMVHVLADNDRLALLPEIAALYEVERASAEGTVQAEVVSATPLSEAQKQGIAGALTKRLGRDVVLDCKVDETLLGGAIIRAGDMVIDGSVVTKLSKLGSTLLH